MTFLTELFLLWHNKLFDKKLVICVRFTQPGAVILAVVSGSVPEALW